MTLEDLTLVVLLCRSAAGLEVSPEKTYLIESRLGRAAQREGFANAAQLLAAVRADGPERLAWSVVESMTSQDTSFFRDQPVFAAIEARLVADLAREARPLRLWSAACSSGQEALSLAMLATRLDPDGARIEIAASDLSRAALDRARAGVYSQTEVQRGLPIRLLLKHFDKAGEDWRAKLELRRRVRYGRVNLAGPLDGVGRFDLILCRNALCDMAGDVREKALAALVDCLAEGGWLVLGSRDDLAAMEGRLDPVQPGGIFQRVGAERSAAA